MIEPLTTAAVKDVLALMPRCKDCRWWDANGRPDLMRDGMCGRAGHADEQGKRDPVIGEAFVTCGCSGMTTCGCQAFLYTAADFGCVRWEAKPDA